MRTIFYPKTHVNVDESINDMDNCNSKLDLKKKLLGDELGISFDEIQEKQYSKKHLKRLVRNKNYENAKAEKRKIQKMKKKLKRQDLKEKCLLPFRKDKIIVPMAKSPNKMKIAIDLSFNNLMNEKEFRKLMKQIQRCYSLNRRSKEPCQFYLTSLKSTILDGLKSKQPGFDNWDINRNSNHFLDIFESHKQNGTLVFLSCDSSNILPSAEIMRKRGGDYVYIIGGLVDHNVHKRLTLDIAEKNNIQHARLPIDSSIGMFTSQVLAVNHVFELMLLIGNGYEWIDAIKKVIPQRKIRRELRNKNISVISLEKDKLCKSENQNEKDDIVSDGLDSSDESNNGEKI